ncbi:MAG: tetratricopeptide repeat protein, partial [Bacteroidota bacterium]
MNCFRGILYLLLLIAPSLAYPQLTSDSLLMLDWYKQAVDFKHQRQYDSAWQYFERVHRIAKQEDWWLHYYKAEKQFARLLRDWQAQPFAAVEKLDSLIPQAAAHLGPQEVETGELYEARANTYNQLGQYSLALQDYVQSLHIRRLNFGELHQRVAASYLNLAPLFLRNQQARKAIRYADLASAILQQDE